MLSFALVREDVALASTGIGDLREIVLFFVLVGGGEPEPSGGTIAIRSGSGITDNIDLEMYVGWRRGRVLRRLAETVSVPVPSFPERVVSNRGFETAVAPVRRPGSDWCFSQGLQLGPTSADRCAGKFIPVEPVGCGLPSLDTASELAFCPSPAPTVSGWVGSGAEAAS